jgi:hypothetical protein
MSALPGGKKKKFQPSRPVAERFWEKVDKSGDCWLWMAYRNKTGYGEFRMPSGSRLAHRVAHELAIGSIPDGLVVEHRCHNPACVRPEHLLAVTQRLNMQNVGKANKNSKLGVRGVWTCPDTGHFRVQVAGKYVGKFVHLADAESAAIAERNRQFVNNTHDRQGHRVTKPRINFTPRDVLDALDRAIKPLDETASSLVLNDRLLDLLIDELIGEDDPARAYGLEPWLTLIDILEPAAYELAMTMDDCDQAGHHWHQMLDQLSARHDAELVAA